MGSFAASGKKNGRKFIPARKLAKNRRKQSCVFLVSFAASGKRNKRNKGKTSPCPSKGGEKSN